VKALLQGVTSAAVGAVAGVVVTLARRSLVDWITVAVRVGIVDSSLKIRKLPEPVLILAAGIVGLWVHHSG
jgi:chromate transporter